jgi:hypothetical protein
MIYFKLCHRNFFLRQCLEDLLLGSLQMNQVKTEKWKEEKEKKEKEQKQKKKKRGKKNDFLLSRHRHP